MQLFWFLAGILTTLAFLVAVLPWLRSLPRFASLPAIPWLAAVAAPVIVASIIGWYVMHGHRDSGTRAAALTMTSTASDTSGAFGSAVKVFGNATGATTGATGIGGMSATAAPKANAGSMDAAIASLEARIAKGGGTAGDWELLAKSFEFLGRPADAAKARARRLPSLADSNPAADSKPGAGNPARADVVVSGEVTLAAALAGKTAAGETLFIVAKSVDSPGIPVAVFRGSVGAWPLKFTLDDSQSMLPGRNLSSSGRVTIEARISKKGQAQPAVGDLQGSSGIINPAEHPSLKITIDRVIS